MSSIFSVDAWASASSAHIDSLFSVEPFQRSDDPYDLERADDSMFSVESFKSSNSQCNAAQPNAPLDLPSNPTIDLPSDSSACGATKKQSKLNLRFKRRSRECMVQNNHHMKIKTIQKDVEVWLIKVKAGCMHSLKRRDILSVQKNMLEIKMYLGGRTFSIIKKRLYSIQLQVTGQLMFHSHGIFVHKDP
ncbi:hypothetical protein KP509_03G089600 [Ceratopteris richardii]|uniref:Uncharacterized protein n=1 Tax=Ceratopteris richardii TaxID=49495 RepID=A0A8T2V9I7_CERRI|nr:hypothetical protein KP509_03G089600 [Ceratopteris richardii]